MTTETPAGRELLQRVLDDNHAFGHTTPETLNAIQCAIHQGREDERQAQGWREIETAPKDGWTRILLACQWDVLIGVRPIDCPDDAAADDHGIACYPTHWMPLPAAPTGGSET